MSTATKVKETPAEKPQATPGKAAPKKKRAPDKKTLEIKQLKEELARAKETSDDNLEYAKQAYKDVQKAQADSIANKQQTKEIIDTVTSFLDLIDTTSKMIKKSLERDLLKNYNTNSERNDK